MSLRSLAAPALALALLFAGCAGSDEPPASSTTSATGSGGATTPGTTNTGAPVNQPPLAILKVRGLDGGEVIGANGSYSLPAATPFLFDASNSTDPENGVLTFAFDLGDGTRASTRVVNHTFAAGNYTVSVVVTDDRGLNDTASITVTVTAAAPTPTALFYDNADVPATWTFTRQIYADPNTAPAPNSTIPQDHPKSAGWHTTTKQKFAGEKSWTMQDEAAGGYHDNEITTMTSGAIDLTAVSKARLTFEFFGDSEKNNVDGLWWAISSDGGKSFTWIGGASGKVNAWRHVDQDLSAYVGKAVQLRFIFRSDVSCSIDTPLPQGCAAGAYTGYFVDEIRIA